MGPRSVPPGRASLLWIAPLTDHSGYADEARGFLRALERAGCRPAAREHRWRDSDAGLTAADRAMLRGPLSREPRAPVVAVHHYIPGATLNVVDGAVNVARTMFETDSIPPAWVPRLLERDEIWVPSQHNVETFRAAGIPERKLRIVGATIDFDLFAPGAPALDPGRHGDEVVFLTNFEFGERKGWRTLLRAWARAFDRRDPVRLILKAGSFDCGEGHVRERIDAFLRTEGSALDRIAPITLRTDTVAPEDMPGLYAGADAYVMPSRGEGWGRPFMEALAMGLPTIGPRWGGNLAFMDEATSWLLDGDLVPVPHDSEPWHGAANGHHWFDPHADALVAALQDIAGGIAGARARASGARADLIARFGPQATARTLTEAADAAVERCGTHRTPSVVFRGPFGSGASLAVVNDRLAGAFEDRGWRVRHRGRGVGSQGEHAAGVTHSWPPAFEPVTDGPTVAVLPWEYGAPPAEWVEEVRARVDRVWVPSAYVRDGYVAGGMPPGVVEVVPNGVDTERYTPDGPAHPLERRAGCVFLFVGGTIYRKGVDALVRAWQEAFAPGDDVLLVIKDFGTATHYRGQTEQQALRDLAQRDDVAPVLYMDDDLPPAALPGLYRAADVLVVPYRGEGFCLPALEALSCGVPVIHTGAGPTGEFVAPEAGWALPARRVPSALTAGLPPLAGEPTVLEVDEPALVAALRDAADPAERAGRAAAARPCALRHGWEQIAGRAAASLEALRREGLPLAREIAPETVDGHDDFVLYAPDWSRPEDWAPALLRWASTFGPADPVTLALYVPGGDADALVDRILGALADAGHAEDALPDLALCEPSGAGPAGLVAGAAAVLVAAGAERPELTRRARRVLRADGDDSLGRFAADLRARAAQLQPA